MKIKANKPEDYFPFFDCILKENAPADAVEKCLKDTKPKIDAAAVKTCAKKVNIFFLPSSLYLRVSSPF